MLWLDLRRVLVNINYLNPYSVSFDMSKKYKFSRFNRAERRKKRNNTILGIVLVGIMVFSSLAFAVFSGPGSSTHDTSAFNYSGYSFTIQTANGNNVYETTINNQKVQFYTTPFEAEKLNVSSDFKNAYLFSKILIVSSTAPPLEGVFPVYEQYINGISKEVEGITKKRVLRGYLSEDPLNEYQKYDCSNAANDTPVIIYHGSYIPNETRNAGIYNTNQSNCYEFVGNEQDILSLRDYLIYFDMGVLK